MIVGLSTPEFNPDEANQLFEEARTVPRTWLASGSIKLAERVLGRPVTIPEQKSGLPKYSSDLRYGLVYEYTGLVDDPTYYLGVPAVRTRTEELIPGQKITSVEHKVSARNLSNLYLGVTHHVGREAAGALVKTVLDLESLNPSAVLTQLNRLQGMGWQPLSDSKPDRGHIIEAAMRATNGHNDRAHFTGIEAMIGDHEFDGIDNSDEIKDGLVRFALNVDPESTVPYIASRNGEPYLLPEGIVTDL